MTNTMTTVGLGTRHTHTVDKTCVGKAVLDRLSRVFMVKTEVYMIQYKAKRTARRDTLATHAVTHGHGDTRASDPPDIAQTPETTDCNRLAEGSNLAQAVLCCAFAAADIAVAIAAVRPSELRLSAGNAMLTVGEASHC